jgi:hypothetical protein
LFTRSVELNNISIGNCLLKSSLDFLVDINDRSNIIHWVDHEHIALHALHECARVGIIGFLFRPILTNPLLLLVIPGNPSG